MPKAATGEVRWYDGVAIARITVRGKTRVSLELPECRTEDTARERAALLARLAQRLRTAGADDESSREALRIVARASAKSLRNALAIVEEKIDGKLDDIGAPVALTFQQFCEQWTSGALHKRHPDQIRAKRTAKSDVSRLTTHVYPVIGSLPIDRIEIEHCEEVMRRVAQADLSTATRRHVGQLLAKAFSMAAYPLRLIARSPIPPKGFLPSLSKRKALAHLYPNEDLRLMQCTAVPLAYRLLWGFVAREGMRAGEAVALKLGDLDLGRGGVRLDQNKTDDPRAWALSIGVLRALRAYFKNHRPNARPDDHVFTDPDGKALTGPALARLLRDHLRVINLDAERPELFATTAHRRQIRAHDLRGTFVTVSLANGKSEAWVMARTGHRSSAMIARYKRVASTFEEIDAGDLTPLDEAIPELRAPAVSEPDCPAIAHGDSGEIANLAKELVGHLGVEPRANGLRIHCSTN